MGLRVNQPKAGGTEGGKGRRDVGEGGKGGVTLLRDNGILSLNSTSTRTVAEDGTPVAGAGRQG